VRYKLSAYYYYAYRDYLSFAASEIAASEIAAKNWPLMQRADILNRRLAFRRFNFTPPRKSPPLITETSHFPALNVNISKTVRVLR